MKKKASCRFSFSSVIGHIIQFISLPRILLNCFLYILLFSVGKRGRKPKINLDDPNDPRAVAERGRLSEQARLRQEAAEKKRQEEEERKQREEEERKQREEEERIRREVEEKKRLEEEERLKEEALKKKEEEKARKYEEKKKR